MSPTLLNDQLSRRVRPSRWADPGTRFVLADAESHASPRWMEIDALLARWLERPAELTEEGIQPPAAVLLVALRSVLPSWSRMAVPPPHAVVPSGNGGVGFEWHHGERIVDLEFRADGQAELRSFDGKRFQLLQRFGLAPG